MSISGKAKKIIELARSLNGYGRNGPVAEIVDLAQKIHDEASLAEVRHVQVTDNTGNTCKLPVMSRRCYESVVEIDDVAEAVLFDTLKPFPCIRCDKITPMTNVGILVCGVYLRDVDKAIGGELVMRIDSPDTLLVGQPFSESIVSVRKAILSDVADVLVNVVDPKPFITEDRGISVTWREIIKPAGMIRFTFGLETLIIGQPA